MGFEICPDTGELFKDDHRIPLQDQPGRLLALLASRPGEVVGRAEIRDILWQDGVIVEFDHAVNTAIKKIRSALDDDPETPRIVETVPKRGYRFIADVEGLEQPLVLPADAPPRVTQERRLSLLAPPTAEPTSIAIAPDGLTIVFAAIVDGRLHLRLRALDTGVERSLPGSDGGQYPFWSPNSRFIGFFAEGALRVSRVDGGTPRPIADAPSGRGGTWSQADVILYAPSTTGPLYRVSAIDGQRAVAQTAIGAGSHRFPRFLTDGQRFLYFATGDESGVYVGDIRAPTTRSIRLPLRADAAVEFAPPGHLLYVAQTTLCAQPFDENSLELLGDPFRVDEQITLDGSLNRAAISASREGSIIYRKGSGGAQRQFVWMNRKGQEIVPVGEPDDNLALGPTLSHDGQFLAMYRTVNGKSDIWVMEIARGIPVRFTTGTGTAANPLWTPDRRRIVFSSNRNGTFDLYARSIASQETEPLVQTDLPKSATSWSPDGRTLLYRALSPGSGYDIWALPFDEAGRPGEPYPVVSTPYDERDAEFSPSGAWIAYQSNRSGRPEVHVQSFPPDSASLPCPVSTRGGAQPRWGVNDSELFYVALDGWLMSVAIDYSPAGRILIHPPERLFLTQIGGAVHSINRPQYMVARDGRFLMNMLTESHSAIELILGWNARP